MNFPEQGMQVWTGLNLLMQDFINFLKNNQLIQNQTSQALGLLYRGCPREVVASVILSKNMYVYMCPIPNGFRDRAMSLYSSKIIDKKQILRTVSNTGIYCSSDLV
jgi:hypothetical protein